MLNLTESWFNSILNFRANLNSPFSPLKKYDFNWTNKIHLFLNQHLIIKEIVSWSTTNGSNKMTSICDSEATLQAIGAWPHQLPLQLDHVIFSVLIFQPIPNLKNKMDEIDCFGLKWNSESSRLTWFPEEPIGV